MTQKRRNRSHGRWGGMWAKAGTTAVPARRIGREIEGECVRVRACVLWTCRRLRAGSVSLEARKAGRVPVACNGDASDGAATRSHWHAGATQAGSVSVCGATCGKNATWVGDSAAAIVFQSIREQNSRAGTSICVCVTRGAQREPGIALITESGSLFFFAVAGRRDWGGARHDGE